MAWKLCKRFKSFTQTIKFTCSYKKDSNKLIEKNIQSCFNVGYLFLQDIYYKLKLNEICEEIKTKYRFKFDFNDIMAKLIFSRIIFPASKLKTLELSKIFLRN